MSTGSVRLACALMVGLASQGLVSCSGDASAGPPRSALYEDLASFFVEWRAFQRPTLIDGVPDYTAGAMAAQQHELAGWQRRLAAIDTAGWTVPQQVDYQVVKAELNGLDFDHRVLKPWARNPAFYVTVFWDQSDQPAREGPLAWGGVELWRQTWPLTPAGVATVDSGIRVIPKLLEQARTNLTGDARDLWTFGAVSIRQQGRDLAQLETRVVDAPGNLKDAVRRAREATDSFATWLGAQAAAKKGPSGVGVENYDWYLKHVQLAPYTWRDEVTLMQRELARASAFLTMEERRNAQLPPQVPVASAEEHARRFGAAVSEYMGFLRDHDIMTVGEEMDRALRARIGSFAPGVREFFTEVDYRDPEVMRTHGYHWFDLARLAHQPPESPIRRVPLLYNIFNTRTEGNATGWEELMLQAGMFDARPRSRELVYVLLAERAARALGDLRMHSNEYTLEQASAFASASTPRGWLRMSGDLVRGEQHLYLQQPAYGTSYLIGKMEIERLLAARRAQLGDGFILKRFMDEFNAAGLVPASLLRWELSGRLPDDVARMLR